MDCLWQGCTLRFQSAQELNSHLKVVHVVEAQRLGKLEPSQGYSCTWMGCDPKPRVRKNFERHVLQHSGLRSFVCPFCYTSFKLVHDIRIHFSTCVSNPTTWSASQVTQFVRLHGAKSPPTGVTGQDFAEAYSTSWFKWRLSDTNRERLYAILTGNSFDQLSSDSSSSSSSSPLDTSVDADTQRFAQAVRSNADFPVGLALDPEAPFPPDFEFNLNAFLNPSLLDQNYAQVSHDRSPLQRSVEMPSEFGYGSPSVSSFHATTADQQEMPADLGASLRSEIETDSEWKLVAQSADCQSAFPDSEMLEAQANTTWISGREPQSGDLYAAGRSTETMPVRFVINSRSLPSQSRSADGSAAPPAPASPGVKAKKQSSLPRPEALGARAPEARAARGKPLVTGGSAARAMAMATVAQAPVAPSRSNSASSPVPAPTAQVVPSVARRSNSAFSPAPAAPAVSFAASRSNAAFSPAPAPARAVSSSSSDGSYAAIRTATLSMAQYDCPICSKQFTGVSLEEFNEHVDVCLTSPSESSGSGFIASALGVIGGVRAALQASLSDMMQPIPKAQGGGDTSVPVRMQGGGARFDRPDVIATFECAQGTQLADEMHAMSLNNSAWESNDDDDDDDEDDDDEDDDEDDKPLTLMERIAYARLRMTKPNPPEFYVRLFAKLQAAGSRDARPSAR
ncbi:hypothetical protein CAOG_06701 [Capsaspora owczarzaki ATCC 30864]|uniref:hypothetical protein n=1 Tax=Capsaspora owczarzaki (strain ATCC 30864) TaxID=595528 RepID=UPI0003520F38|nr:hypothetical protein CAOG_06701 [Capsaspora owczarzaki ATCC 30864]|eukprot:XP_004344322.2 hypothetical protein CAOG_06701 [Capsaspora owczarzaki ATCC 30864]